MKPLNLIVCFFFAGLALLGVIVSLAKWTLDYAILAFVFAGLSWAAWEDYKELRDDETFYKKFKNKEL